MGLFGTFMNQLTARAESQGRKIGFVERAGAGLSAGVRRPQARGSARELQIRHRRAGAHHAQRGHRGPVERRIPDRRARDGAQLRPIGFLLRGQEPAEGHEPEPARADADGQRGGG
ncbi:hypothetical protein EPUL_006025, partial [Erysiphe pulchra]